MKQIGRAIGTVVRVIFTFAILNVIIGGLCTLTETVFGKREA